MNLILGGGRKPNQPNEITPQEVLGIEVKKYEKDGTKATTKDHGSTGHPQSASSTWRGSW